MFLINEQKCRFKDAMNELRVEIIELMQWENNGI